MNVSLLFIYKVSKLAAKLDVYTLAVRVLHDVASSAAVNVS